MSTKDNQVSKQKKTQNKKKKDARTHTRTHYLS